MNHSFFLAPGHQVYHTEDKFYCVMPLTEAILPISVYMLQEPKMSCWAFQELIVSYEHVCEDTPACDDAHVYEKPFCCEEDLSGSYNSSRIVDE